MRGERGLTSQQRNYWPAFEVWRMRHNHDLVGGRTARDFIFAYLPQYLCDKGPLNQPSSSSIS